MKEYNELSAYEEEAEDIYDDYNPYEEEYEEDDFFDEEDEEDYDDYYDDDEDYDDEDNYLPYDDEDYDTYNVTSVGRIDPNDRTITVVVTNTSDTNQSAIIFAGNEGPSQADGVSVSVEESSHKEVQEESKSNPFKISGLKLSVSNELQLDFVLKVTRKTATGSNTTRVYQPRNASSPQNFSAKMIDDSSFEMDVTGSDSLRFTILAKTTAVFTFTIKARANVGNILKGGSVAEMSRAPRTTGLPQIDLVRRKKRKRPAPPKAVSSRKSRRKLRRRRSRPKRRRRFSLRRRRR